MPSKVVRRKVVRRKVQEPAKPFVGNGPNERGEIPAAAQLGRLTLEQIKHAVETALRGHTFEADADE